MAALVMVPVVAVLIVASVAEPVRLIPPHSPPASGEGHDCTKMDGQLWMLVLPGIVALSRRLVKTLVRESLVSLASSVAPVKLMAPVDFTTLPPGTTRVPLLKLRSPFNR